MKRINPETNKPFSQGQTEMRNGELMYFEQYDLREDRIKNKYFSEIWYDKEQFHIRKVGKVLGNANLRDQKKGNPKGDLTVEYLLDLFPFNERCPCLGIKLEWCGDPDNSPSLDRINNDKGYVKGNVVWISHYANSIKRNATIDQLLTLGKFYKRMEILNGK